jgi:hypothetical protein
MIGNAPCENTCATARLILIEGFLEIGRDRKDVAEVAHRHLLAEIDPDLEIIGCVKRRNPADCLRTKAGARPKGRAAVERRTEDRRVVLPGVANILDIGRLEEGVDPGVMRQLAPREGRDGSIFDALSPGQPHLDRPLPLGLPRGLRQGCLAVDRPPSLEPLLVEIRMVVASISGQGIGDPAARRNKRSPVGVEHRFHGGLPSCAVETLRDGSIRGTTRAIRRWAPVSRFDGQVEGCCSSESEAPPLACGLPREGGNTG